MDVLRSTAPEDIRDIRETAEWLGGFAAWCARVNRATVHDDGRPENNAEHSFMLSIVAPYLANEFYPTLDTGLVSQYATAHDFVEAYVDDTPTFGISVEDRFLKEQREAEATILLSESLPPYWAALHRRYEEQAESEARFVRLVDKIMPAIMHIHGDGNKVFADTYGVYDEAGFYEKLGNSRERLKSEFPEFPELHDIRNQMIEKAVHKMFRGKV